MSSSASSNASSSTSSASSSSSRSQSSQQSSSSNGNSGSESDWSSGPSGGGDLSSSSDSNACPCGEEIQLNGEPITNANRTVLVGQKISLSINCNDYTLTGIEWTIPGKTFVSWTPNRTNSSLILLSAQDLAQQSVSFCWIDGANEREVKVEFKIGQATCVKTARLKVMRPAVTISGEVRRQVSVAPGWNEDPAIHLGTQLDRGIEIRHSSASVSGEYKWLQVGGVFRRYHDSVSNETYRYEGFGLDHSFPFPGVDVTGVAYDSPGTGLAGTTVNVSDSFTMYLMFKPNLSNAQFVPVRAIGWFWRGRADLANGNWSLVANTASQGMDATDYAPTDHPAWADNLTDVFKRLIPE